MLILKVEDTRPHANTNKNKDIQENKFMKKILR